MDQLMARVVFALCEDVGTPLAAAVKRHVQKSEWRELLQLRAQVPSSYTDAHSYWCDVLVTDLLRKCKINTGIDTEAVARRTFYECEAQNWRTNSRLTRYIDRTLFIEDENDKRVLGFIDLWRKEVSWVLGKLPIDLTPRFSGGATYADSGMLITIPDKMSSAPTITQDARCLLPLFGDTSWSRALVRERPWISDPDTVRGNKFFTVPKDGEKDRGCCKEPSVNVTYQLDVGREIRHRLERIGIDLISGQDLHRRLACKASRDGSLATVDMSNASDTLCRLLPELVLPDTWFQLLDSLRSKHTEIDGKVVFVEKFSSMGNGFTFELETLIFSTLARVLIRENGGDPELVRCYGDDLIIPSDQYLTVLAGLKMFGFSPNMKKTFAEGPFRESCGGDFFSGVPVRAHFVKELPDEPQQWIALANGLRRTCHVDDDPELARERWPLVKRAWLRCLDAIPSAIRACRGPVHLGDQVIHDEPEFWTLRNHPKSDASHEALFVRGYCPIPVVLPWHHWNSSVQLASCTLGIPAAGVTPRGGVSGYRIRLLSTLRNHWIPKGEPRRFATAPQTPQSAVAP